VIVLLPAASWRLCRPVGWREYKSGLC